MANEQMEEKRKYAWQQGKSLWDMNGMKDIPLVVVGWNIFIFTWNDAARHNLVFTSRMGWS